MLYKLQAVKMTTLQESEYSCVPRLSLYPLSIDSILAYGTLSSVYTL